MKTAIVRAIVWIAAVSSCSPDEGFAPPLSDDYDICADPLGYNIGSQEELESYLDCGHEPLRLTILRGVDNLRPLRGVTTIDALRFEKSAPSLEGLESVTSLGTLALNDTTLSSFELPALREVDSIQVMGNADLVSLSFPGLSFVDAVSIVGNRSLAEISMPVCQMDGDIASIELADNPVLDTVDFPLLDRVSQLAITNCGFVDLSGFSALTSIRRLDDFEWSLNVSRLGMRIVKNPNLVSLAGLENVAVIAQQLVIQRNDELTTVDGLARLTALTPVSPTLEVFLGILENRKLPACLAEEVAMQLKMQCINCTRNGPELPCPR